MGTRRGERGWEIPADIIADAKPHRCDGHHPVTVMERAVVNDRFRCYAKGNLAEMARIPFVPGESPKCPTKVPPQIGPIRDQTGWNAKRASCGDGRLASSFCLRQPWRRCRGNS